MTRGTIKRPQGRPMRSAGEFHDGAVPRRWRQSSGNENCRIILPQRPAFRCRKRGRCAIRTPP